ncbi:hypothetical protein ACH4RA_13085 [Streptomyces smyrnaeus]|uniref:hypothetical protein n=1 Tax=Streptomyces TaxID=1883 RepID=UPI001615876D|nr:MULTISPECIES: hypothetical protein [unclassified Streptomyces]MBQ0863155.1 hypothetical protein [Streptomyces sp. RK75]MBQ1123044.1 hypothetical protein [Streptomyces sp. B15]MBQ1161814.1 hypothetical protein [Streptomyces sp. A73]
MSATVLDEDGSGSAPTWPPPRAEHPRDASCNLQCPSCGSANVAQVLGDNGGVSYVCTACGHIWS